MRVWIYAKRENSRACAFAVKAAEVAERSGLAVAVHPSLADLTNARVMPPESVGEWADVALVVGGDGTFIRYFHETPNPPPVVGVHAGGVGFLMEILPSRMEEAILGLKEGGWSLEERAAGILSAGTERVMFVNDVVVTSLRHNVLISLEARVDGQLVESGRADGFIVATPTGSTAYALSAGGPILDPAMETLEFIPLAPFTVLLKPLIVPASKRLVVRLGGDSRVIVDGLVNFTAGGELAFSVQPRAIKVVKLSVNEPLSCRLKRRLLDISLSRGL